MSLETLNGIMIFILGLIFGSFYNVVGYRLPNNMSIVFPQSHCPNCNHKLKFYELIPVLSYIFLLGRCKVCKKRISFSYPFFENDLFWNIVLPVFLISYVQFGLSLKFFISITFISILIIISISDIRYYIIPDEVLITGSILLIIEFITNSYINNLGFINGVLIKILNGLGSFAILYLFKVFGDTVFQKESLGGGDIKLLFIIGLVLGFDMSIVAIFIASFIALPLSIISLIKNDNNILPFGPYLSIAATIILLCNLNLDMILQFFIK